MADLSFTFDALDFNRTHPPGQCDSCGAVLEDPEGLRLCDACWAEGEAAQAELDALRKSGPSSRRRNLPSGGAGNGGA
jgi:hypothetical protein